MISTRVESLISAKTGDSKIVDCARC